MNFHVVTLSLICNPKYTAGRGGSRIFIGGGGGGAKDYDVRACTSRARSAKPEVPYACIMCMEALGVCDALLCYLSLIIKHFDTNGI